MKGFIRRLTSCKSYYCNLGSEAKWLSRKSWVIENLFFAYRRQIAVTEQSGNDLTDYQVLIKLNSSNFDFSHVKSDGSDIRFYDGNNFLDYWIEEWDSVNQEARVWVKVPNISANGTTSFYMYYGNSNISSASDVESIFNYYENFEECEVGTKYGGSYLCNDLIHNYDDIYFKILEDEFGSKIFRQEDNSTSRAGKSNIDVSSYLPSHTQFRLIVRGRTSDNFYASWGVANNDAIEPNGRHEFWVGINSSGKYVDAMRITLLDADGNEHSFDLDDYDQDNYHTYVVGITPDDVKVWADGNYLGHSGVSYISDNPANYIHIRTGVSQAGTHDTDWIAIAKYTDPEPSVSIGNEETP